MTFDGTGTTAAAAQGWDAGSSDDILGDIKRAIEEVDALAKAPRLLRVVVRTGELPGIHGLIGAAVPVAEHDWFHLRWLMVWTDAFRFCTDDGRIHETHRSMGVPLETDFIAPQFRIPLVPPRPFAPVYISYDPGFDFAPMPKRRKRASKGRRKHVRRQKAAERRARGYTP